MNYTENKLRNILVLEATKFALSAFNPFLEKVGTYVRQVKDTGKELIICLEDHLTEEQFKSFLTETISLRKNFETLNFPLDFEFPDEDGAQITLSPDKELPLDITKLRKVWRRGGDSIRNKGFDRPWVLSLLEPSKELLRIYPDTHRLEFVAFRGRNPELVIPAKVYENIEKPIPAMKEYSLKILKLVLADKTESLKQIREICNWIKQ